MHISARITFETATKTKTSQDILLSGNEEYSIATLSLEITSNQ